MDLAHRLADLTAPTGEEKLLNVRYPTPRLRITPRHGLFVVAAAAVLCAVVGGHYLFASEPAEEAPVTFPLATSSAAEPPGEIVVSVVGAVTHPGLTTLAPGARAADALAQAGPLPEAELLGINQAQKLNDGVQIVVPKQGEAVPAPAGNPGGGSGAGGGKVSLNTATAADLIALSGVGEKTAAAIIAHRDSIGGYTSVEQLKDVKGIGPAKYAELEKQVTL